MALAASGTLAMSSMRNEYKASSGAISMSELARSGSYVPNLTINSGVPTSGQRSISQYYSSGSDINMDASYTTSDYSTAPTSATSIITAYNNGNLAGTGGVASFSGTWVGAASAPGAYYECYLEVISGSSPDAGDSVATWIALTSDRSWTLTTAGVASSKSATWRLHIRNAATDVTKDYTDISVSVVTDPGK